MNSNTQAAPNTPRSEAAFRNQSSTTIWGLVLRLGFLALVNAFSIWFLYRLIFDGEWPFAIVVALTALMINVFWLRDDLRSWRWFTPGLALLLLMVVYPTLFTVYVSFTNYQDGNLLTKPQAIRVLEQQTYLAEDATSYSWAAFRSEETGEFALWLVDDDDNAFFARQGAPLVPADDLQLEIGELSRGVPEAIEGYETISRATAAREGVDQVTYGEEPDVIGISGRAAAPFQQRYAYDADTDSLTDQQSGTVYEPVRGTFTSSEGDEIRPGYYVPIGLDNFQEFLTSPALRGPFFTVFVWTFVHALGAVVLTFSLGLFLAIILNHPSVPYPKVLRSIILIPYAIPSFIAVLVWRGLLQPQLGIVNDLLSAVTFGLVEVPWYSDPAAARAAILLIQTWLGFPYMLLICTGALQSLPSSMYEAAEVDGAGPLRQFWNLTLPLVMVAVAPLLIASFAFNFNNFTVIDLYRDGGPPIPGTTTPAGYTDILITYTFRLAFESGAGADYGLATAITIVIFILLTVITIFNFRLTKPLEEISENV